MKVNKRVLEIYEVEFMNLIEELRGMSVEERELNGGNISQYAMKTRIIYN